MTRMPAARVFLALALAGFSGSVYGFGCEVALLRFSVFFSFTNRFLYGCFAGFQTLSTRCCSGISKFPGRSLLPSAFRCLANKAGHSEESILACYLP